MDMIPRVTFSATPSERILEALSQNIQYKQNNETGRQVINGPRWKTVAAKIFRFINEKVVEV